MKLTTPATLVQAVDAVSPVDGPVKPVVYLTSELRNFAVILNDFGPRFIGRGIPQEFLDCALPLADLLTTREAIWNTGRFDSQQTQIEWKKMVIEVYHIQHKLEVELKLALMEHPEKLRYLTSEAPGRYNIEKRLMYLEHMIALAQKNQDLLDEYKVDPQILEDAERIFNEMSQMVAEKNMHTQNSSANKLNRDRAATFAVDYMSYIRKFADSIFVDDAEIRNKFNTFYISRTAVKPSLPDPVPNPPADK